jgi:hypothetical protein
MSIARGNAHSSQKTFTLEYAAKDRDECDGKWLHDYFLESDGGEK